MKEKQLQNLYFTDKQTTACAYTEKANAVRPCPGSPPFPLPPSSTDTLVPD